MEFIHQSSKTGRAYDIGDLVKSINWDTDIDSQPGKLTFDCLFDKAIVFNHGDIIRLKIDGKGIFFGYAFIIKRNKTNYSITAYDQLRYLKNQDTYVISNMTSSQVFEKICSEQKLNYKVVDKSYYVIAAKVHDNKSFFDILQEKLDYTLIHQGVWYIIRDNFGVLEHVALPNLVTDLLIGDESVLEDYDFEGSIDDDVYNKIKLVKENKETKKREVYIVQDSKNMALWGTLQFFKTVDEKANIAQITEQAEMLLKAKNNPVKKLSLKCLGDLRIQAGNGIVIGISDLENEGLSKYQRAVVESCKHSFSGNKHTMDVKVRVV